MSDVAICTIVAKNYLAHARSLVDSYLQNNPSARAFVLLVDEVDDRFDPSDENFVLIRDAEIGIPEYDSFSFQYTVLELSTAVKPYFLAYLFEHYDLEKLCYFDPDIIIYDDLEDLSHLLDEASIVLTPHLLAPLEDDRHPSELEILQAGSYNLGFIGLHRSEGVSSFLGWWQQKLAKFAGVDIARGLFTDQKWIDLVPSLFPNVTITRDPGYNVAYWNLKNRGVQCQDGQYAVNGSPLKFFHFSGFSPESENAVSKHQDRFTLRRLPPDTRALYKAYKQTLLEHGYYEVKNWDYAYNRFADGVRIPDVARVLWRDDEGASRRWGNPYEVDAPACFREWLNEPVDDVSDAPQISHLVLAVYEQRGDLQRAFPDVFGAHREAFVRWFVENGRSLGFDRCFTQPLADSLPSRAQSAPRTTAPPRASTTTNPLRSTAGPYFRLLSALDRVGVRSALRRLVNQERRLQIREALVGDGLSLQRSRRSPTSRPTSPEQPLQAQPATEAEQTEWVDGVNLIGYLQSESGVGEAARAVARAFESQDYPLGITTIDSSADLARKKDTSLSHLPRAGRYPFNLLHVNADQVYAVLNELGPKLPAAKINIGFWFWEVQEFPQRWFDRFDYFHEIWVASSFTQASIAAVSPVPVVKMPLYLEPPVVSPVARAALGLPESKFIFFFAFDALSVVERKNPLSIIEAYRRAFGTASREAVLVMKINNLGKLPGKRQELLEAMESVSGVLIDSYLDRSVLAGLHQASDAFVSLHRAEGFGLSLAESMQLGKPVIATAYSGNMDFMTNANSYLVNYELVEREREYFPYEAGGVWAEPDVEHAAHVMREVYENQHEAHERGQLAKKDIERLYSAERAGRHLVKRLRRLSTLHGAGGSEAQGTGQASPSSTHG